MRRCKHAAVKIFTVVALISTGQVRTGNAAPSDSPIAGSRQMAPAPIDYFTGRLKPVPELVQRQEIKSKNYIPFDPLGYPPVESVSEQFRRSKARTPSGIWKLTTYYSGLDGQLGYTTPEATLVQFGAAIDHWQNDRPESPTPIIIKGLYLIQYAMAATFLSTTKETVTPEKLELQKQRFEEAHAYLARNKDVGSLDPHWYATMLRVMGYQCASRDEMMKVLEEGAGRHPDYYQMYFDFVYGFAQCSRSPDEFDEAVAKVVDLGLSASHDTDRSGMYARIYWYVSGFVPGGQLSILPHFDWQKMKAGFDDVIKQYDEPWNINSYANFACMAGDAPKLRELLPRALAFPVVKVWGTSEYFADCWEQAALPPPPPQGQ